MYVRDSKTDVALASYADVVMLMCEAEIAKRVMMSLLVQTHSDPDS